MHAHITLAAVAVFFTLPSGCSATMSRSWDDDYAEMGAQRGGKMTYLNQGADFVIEQRRQSAVDQAKNYCAGRPIFFVDEKSTVSQSQGSVPVQNTVQHSGTVTSGYQSANYNGTSTYTTYQPVTYTWNHNHATFICGDADVKAPVYVIRVPDEDSPAVCKAVEEAVAPGERRIRKMAESDGSDDCVEKEGWLRQAVDDRKIHVFVGDKGKSLCRKLEEEMVQGTVAGRESNMFLRKRLSCGGSALTH